MDDKKTEVFNRVANVIVQLGFGIEQESIKLSSNLAEDFGEDSLDAVDLAMELEDEFSIEIDDNDVVFETVEDIVNYVAAKDYK